MQSFPDHHELSASSLHVHLDSTNSPRVNIPRGNINDVHNWGGHLSAERGIRHGVVLPIDSDSQ